MKTNEAAGSYTKAWPQFEDTAITELKQILQQHIPQLTATHFDRGKSGREKNRLADLAAVVGGKTIEISVKAARRSGNSKNDMGTFRDHPNRKQRFAASFTLWVRYDDSARKIRCYHVFFDKTWRHVGKSSYVNGVKYR